MQIKFIRRRGDKRVTAGAPLAAPAVPALRRRWRRDPGCSARQRSAIGGLRSRGAWIEVATTRLSRRSTPGSHLTRGAIRSCGFIGARSRSGWSPTEPWRSSSQRRSAPSTVASAEACARWRWVRRTSMRVQSLRSWHPSELGFAELRQARPHFGPERSEAIAPFCAVAHSACENAEAPHRRAEGAPPRTSATEGPA